MDLKNFLNHIKKYKWLLITVPLLTVITVYFLVKNLPDEYQSQAQISTGLVDQSKQVSGSDQNMDYFKLSQQFSNIIEKMKMKRMYNILSYHLILHDLTNPVGAFKKFSPKLDSLSVEQRSELIDIYKQKLKDKSILTPADNYGKYPLYSLMTSMEYDDKGIAKKLDINRNDGSDFINVTYTSHNPELSAFVVNTLSNEFIRNYSLDVGVNQNNSIELLDSLLKIKESTMNSKNSELKQFKMKNGVLNLDSQSETVYAQISANEERKAQAINLIQANQGAISAIEAKLRGKDPLAGGNVVAQNQEIIRLKNQLKIANDKYIDGGFRAQDKSKIDSLSNIISERTVRNSDANITDPTVNKQNLIQQRTNLEISLNQAKSSIASMDRELAVLRGKYNSMVPFDAGIQNYERDAELATKDYMDALNRYNQTRTEQNIGLKLDIAQIGLIGTPEASKKMLLTAGSGIGSFALCFAAVVLLFFLDTTISSTKQLQEATSSPVIGHLSVVKIVKSFKEIWADSEDSDYKFFKNQLRTLRLDISNLMEKDSSSILGITSLGHGEGKSFLSSSLAYAFAKTGKKVLLIGGESQIVENQKSKELAIRGNFETFLIKREINANDLITVLNKNDDDSSLLEIQSLRNLRAGFDVLKNEFDLIIIDIQSIKDINLAKEWLLFAEKTIAVFESGRALTGEEKNLLANLKDHESFIGWVLNKVKHNNN